MNEPKFMLPFAESPYATMYNYLAFPLGIIQANGKDKIIPWLCGKYINCSYNSKIFSKFTICTSDLWALEDEILSFQMIRLYEKTWNDLGWDPLEFVKDMIINGNYPCGEYNEEFIPSSSFFQKNRRIHDYLIIGFDDAEQAFYCVGYTKTGHFEQFFVPYDCMRKAFETTHHPKICFGFVNYNNNADFAINFSRIIDELKNYVDSRPTIVDTNTDNNLVFGIAAIEALIESARESEYIDSRYTRGFMEHKYFMNLRMEYLNKGLGILSDKYSIVSSNVYKLAEKVHLLNLKYILTHKVSMLERIIGIMEEVLLIERDYLPQVIDLLDEYENRKKSTC